MPKGKKKVLFRKTKEKTYHRQQYYSFIDGVELYVDSQVAEKMVLKYPDNFKIMVETSRRSRPPMNKMADPETETNVEETETSNEGE